MKRVLIDTNVVLDVLLNRRPHVSASALIWAAVEQHRVEGLLAAHAITTIHYLIHRDLGAAPSRKAIRSLLQIFEIAPVTSAVLQDAIALSVPDFDDAVTASAGAHARCEAVVTRDPKGFQNVPLRCLTPESAAPLLV